MITQRKIEDAASNAGWNCLISKRNGIWNVNFNTDTRFGQDVQYDFDVKRLSDVREKVEEIYEGYDVDYETYIWLDPHTGHPTRKAPSSIVDLVHNMEEVESKLGELTLSLNEIENPQVNNKIEKEISIKDVYDILLGRTEYIKQRNFIDKYKGACIDYEKNEIRLDEGHIVKLIIK